MASENEVVVVEDEKEMKSKENVMSNSNERRAKQGLNSSGTESSKTKTSKDSKTNKSGKNESSSRISVVFGRSTKASLSQSLSFPGRGRHSDIMKRSIEVYPTKSEVKQFQKNSSKVESRVADGNVGSSRRIKKPFPGVNPIAGKAAAARASLPTLTQSTKSEATNLDLGVKEEDAGSTTSSNLTPRRINASSFSFRLEQRAEKRKEFFSKIEQKVQAKEVEKSNQQEKSKENQEAEIKQFRKSLTFKATPMPSFYTEPPPKIELKKIPTTRPISPKLGRHKGGSSENGASPRAARDGCRSPKSPLSTNEKGFKKSMKSSLSRVLTQESTTPTKAKSDKQTDTEEKDSCCSNGSLVASSNPEPMPARVAVEG